MRPQVTVATANANGLEAVEASPAIKGKRSWVASGQTAGENGVSEKVGR